MLLLTSVSLSSTWSKKVCSHGSSAIPFVLSSVNKQGSLFVYLSQLTDNLPVNLVARAQVGSTHSLAKGETHASNSTYQEVLNEVVALSRSLESDTDEDEDEDKLQAKYLLDPAIWFQGLQMVLSFVDRVVCENSEHPSGGEADDSLQIGAVSLNRALWSATKDDATIADAKFYLFQSIENAFMLQLLSRDGSVLLSLEDVRVDRFDKFMKKRQNVMQASYSWICSELHSANESESEIQSFLQFLSAEGKDIVCVGNSKLCSYVDSLIQHTGCARYFSAVDDLRRSSSGTFDLIAWFVPSGTVEDASSSIVFLQTLLGVSLSVLCEVSKRIVFVCEDGVASLLFQALSGVIVTATQEYPNCAMTVLTLSTPTNVGINKGRHVIYGKNVLREMKAMLAGESELEVLYVNQERRCKRYKVVSAGSTIGHSEIPSSFLSTRSQCWIVTGGLGGLGLLTAKVLVKLGARHLFLVSRSGKIAYEGQGL
ncbi:KR domain-containing protein, partial [archaeon]